MHALLVVLSSKSPHPLLTTDELRRGIESLDAAAYSVRMLSLYIYILLTVHTVFIHDFGFIVIHSLMNISLALKYTVNSIYVFQTWSYYEKWVSSMCIMLLERGVILESELYEELDGDSLSRSGTLNEVPKFNPGDKIKIRSESTRVRWRRPHIRCLTSITHELVYVGYDDNLFVPFNGNTVVQGMCSDRQAVL